jgi:hypothetical protein
MSSESFFMSDPSIRRRRTLAALLWIALSIGCLTIDYALGPFIQFPIVYLVPVSLAAWHSGRTLSLALAVILPLCRLYFITLWDPPWTFPESAVNAAIRIAVLASFAWLVDRTASQTRRLSSEVLLLTGMLPVCSRCRKIRQAGGDWQPLDTYVAQHPGEFKHELCPDCAQISADVFNRR